MKKVRLPRLKLHKLLLFGGQMKKRVGKGYIREVRLLRLTLHKLQSHIRQLERALDRIGHLHAKTHKRYQADRQALLAALKDAVAIIDEERCGKCQWTMEDIRRLERARLLSLGV